MNLTPEQWRDLDKAMEGTRADVAAWAQHIVTSEAVTMKNVGLEEAAVECDAAVKRDLAAAAQSEKAGRMGPATERFLRAEVLKALAIRIRAKKVNP